MRTSHRNPKLSAFEDLEGQFNYNKTPLAPPGCKVLVHEKKQQITTWGARAIYGWYIGPELKHYRCSKVFISSTRSERVTDTVQFFPSTSSLPALTQDEALIHATEDLTKEIFNQRKHDKKSGHYEETLEAIQRLMQLFPNEDKIPLKQKISEMKRMKIKTFRG